MVLRATSAVFGARCQVPGWYGAGFGARVTKGAVFGARDSRGPRDADPIRRSFAVRSSARNTQHAASISITEVQVPARYSILYQIVFQLPLAYLRYVFPPFHALGLNEIRGNVFAEGTGNDGILFYLV